MKKGHHRPSEIRDTRGDDEQVIPEIEEHVEVDRRTRESGRLRVRRPVRERRVEVDEERIVEEAHVEHVPVGRYVDTVPEVREEDDAVVVPVVEEVLVLERRLLLREEIRIRKERHRVPDRRTVSLRRQDVTIERMPPDEEPEPTG